MAFFRALGWRLRRQLLSQALFVAMAAVLMLNVCLLLNNLWWQLPPMRLLARMEGWEDAWYWTMNDTDLLNAHQDGETDVMPLLQAFYGELERRALDTGALAVGSLTTESFREAGGSEPRYLQLYNDTLASRLRLPLRAGGWLDTPTQDGRPAVVVDALLGARYPVGSVLTAAFDTYDAQTRNWRTDTLEAQVVGVLDMGGYIFDMTGGGNSVTADMLFNTIAGYAIMREADFPLARSWTGDYDHTRLLFPAQGASREAAAAAARTLQPTGFLMTRGQIVQKSRDSLLFNLGNMLPKLVPLLVLGILSLAGNMYLANVLSRKENAVYLILGARPKWVAGIEWARAGLLLAVAAGLAILYFRQEILYGNILAGACFGGSALTAALLLAVAPAVIRLGDAARPVDLLRRWD